MRQRVVGPEGGVLDARRVGRQRGGQRVHRRQLLALHPDQPRRLLRGVPGLRGDGRHGLAVVRGLAGREHRPVAALRPEAWHRLGQVGWCHHEAHARDVERGPRVDRADARPCDVERHELDVEGVLEADVGDVCLPPGDALDTADPGRGAADARRHCGASSASGVDERSPTGVTGSGSFSA